jgi:simple sugar transport system permease protein
MMAGLGGAFLSLGDLGLFGRQMTAGRGFLAIAAVIFGRWRPGGAFVACLLFGSADALELRLQAESSVPRQVWLLIAIAFLAYGIVSQLRRKKDVRREAHLLATGALFAAFFTLFVLTPHVAAPSQLWLALPYIVTLVALSGMVGKADAPLAWTVPYDRQAI